MTTKIDDLEQLKTLSEEELGLIVGGQQEIPFVTSVEEATLTYTFSDGSTIEVPFITSVDIATITFDTN